jgi:hypothetical protein
MEAYREMLIAELERRGVRVNEKDAPTMAAVTRMVRVLENEMTEFGPVGVAAFVLGVLTAKGWTLPGIS